MNWRVKIPFLVVLIYATDSVSVRDLSRKQSVQVS